MGNDKIDLNGILNIAVGLIFSRVLSKGLKKLNLLKKEESITLDPLTNRERKLKEARRRNRRLTPPNVKVYNQRAAENFKRMRNAR